MSSLKTSLEEREEGNACPEWFVDTMKGKDGSVFVGFRHWTSLYPCHMISHTVAAETIVPTNEPKDCEYLEKNHDETHPTSEPVVTGDYSLQPWHVKLLEVLGIELEKMRSEGMQNTPEYLRLKVLANTICGYSVTSLYAPKRRMDENDDEEKEEDFDDLPELETSIEEEKEPTNCKDLVIDMPTILPGLLDEVSASCERVQLRNMKTLVSQIRKRADLGCCSIACQDCIGFWRNVDFLCCAVARDFRKQGFTVKNTDTMKSGRWVISWNVESFFGNDRTPMFQ